MNDKTNNSFDQTNVYICTSICLLKSIRNTSMFEEQKIGWESDQVGMYDSETDNLILTYI